MEFFFKGQIIRMPCDIYANLFQEVIIDTILMDQQSQYTNI